MSLSFDLTEAERALREADPKLGLVMDRHGPCGLEAKGVQSPFAVLAESITYQQLNGKAAATIFSRVVGIYRPKRFPKPEDILATEDAALRAAGLSRGPDILPASDFGVRKGFGKAFKTRGFPTPAQVMRRGDRWRPYRSVASWFLWRAADSPDGRA